MHDGAIQESQTDADEEERTDQGAAQKSLQVRPSLSSLSCLSVATSPLGQQVIAAEHLKCLHSS